MDMLCEGRLCLGFHARLHLVKPYGFELSESRLRRAGLDYWKDVDLVEHETADDFFSHAAGTYSSIVGFSAPHRFGVQPLTEFDMGITPESKTCLVFGSETHGMEFLTDEQRDAMRMVYLPISPAIRSLNLATCVSIGLFEAVRQAGVTQAELVSLADAAGKRARIGRWEGSPADSQR